jgi:GNAT superfamily N-acetyltransferase
MDTGRPPHPLEENLWAVNRDFARVPGAVVHDDPDLLWFTCPGRDSWLNGASRCTLGDDAEAAVGRVITAWDDLGAAAIWHQTPSSTPTELPAILARNGFEAGIDPGMTLRLDRPFAPAPPELTIEAVVDRDRVLDWVNTFDNAFGGNPRGLSHPWLEPFAALYLEPDSAGRLFTGWVEGIPVTTALAFVGGGAVGIYGVGTIPEQRGRGYGSAVTIAGIEWGRRNGADLAVLEATEAGLPVYRRLGFETVFETTTWFRRPTAATRP